MKRILVKYCVECPYRARNYEGKLELCDVADRQIMNIPGIPSWCPLPEVVGDIELQEEVK